MVRTCLELPYGSVKHFPAGTYNEQMTTWGGRVEMDAMSIVQQAWRAFSHLSASEWSQSERRFVKWFSEKPQIPQTNATSVIVARLWGAPLWLLLLLGVWPDG